MVEGVNLISKHTKPNAANPQGGIIKQEAKIHISNLMLIDSKLGEPTKVGRKRDENRKVSKIFKKNRRSNKIMEYTPRLKKKYQEEVVENLKKRYKSVMQVPKLVKICLNQGLEAFHQTKNK